MPAPHLWTNMKMLTSVQVLKIQSTEDYDGFETYCGFEIQNNIFLPDAYAEEKYEGRMCACEHEDDSYCMLQKAKCEHQRKIGYIQVGEYERLYPQVGEYVIIDGKRKFVVSETEFKNRFMAEC